jgi:hypothetical protein
MCQPGFLVAFVDPSGAKPMKKNWTHFVVAGALFTLAAAILVLAPSSSIAQTVRAAFVRNIDEPGLVPFSETFSISQSECGCTNCCFIRTAAVPAGKRLVIQNISGWFPQTSVGNAGYINVSQEDPGGGGSAVINTITPVFRNQWNGGDYPAYEFNQMTMAFVDPGKRASITIFSGVTFGFRTGNLTINGYMVTLP